MQLEPAHAMAPGARVLVKWSTLFPGGFSLPVGIWAVGARSFWLLLDTGAARRCFIRQVIFKFPERAKHWERNYHSPLKQLQKG